MFFKINVLKKFRKFHRKTHALESLSNKVAGLKPAALLKRNSTCSFIKKKLEDMCSPLKFMKFLRTPFSTEHLSWLFLFAPLPVISITASKLFVLGVILVRIFSYLDRITPNTNTIQAVYSATLNFQQFLFSVQLQTLSKTKYFIHFPNIALQ